MFDPALLNPLLNPFQIFPLTNDFPTYSAFGYLPSIAACAFFLSLFSLLTIAHAVLAARTRGVRQGFWLWSMVIGGGLEIVGWIGRMYASYTDVYSPEAFLDQAICLILGPTFMSATIYAMLGMVINQLGRPDISKISPRSYLIIFIIADIVSLTVQGVGGGILAIAVQKKMQSPLGTYILLSGVACQLGSMLIFSYFAIDTFLSIRREKIVLDRGLTRLMYGLAIGSCWILLRCVYRTIELSGGSQSFLILHESFFLALDATPMVLCLATFIPTHPYFTISPHLTEIILEKTVEETADEIIPCESADSIGEKAEAV